MYHSVCHMSHTCMYYSYSEQEVAEEVKSLRVSLSEKPRPIDPYASDSHMLAEATEAKKQQLKRAFGIREDYVEGSAFAFGQPAATEEKAKTEEKTE